MGCPRSGSDSSLLARNEHRHRSKVSVRRLSERNRIPPGVPTGQPSPYGRAFLLAIFCGIRTHGGRNSNIRNLGRRRRYCCRFNLLLASIDSLRSLPASQDDPLGHRFLRSPPGVQKIRQEQQNVENLADFSFPVLISFFYD